eukprot:TRINITY_DN10663_c1_g1_i2.p2 TRINITY_DN10663_c1_g1~~TRINITY_DN10663_c1_g1_i2.p2  ORF type:complete len:115 (-),score=2.64 TRINITY_DN10663_c1_g1_i2:78-422(-)
MMSEQQYKQLHLYWDYTMIERASFIWIQQELTFFGTFDLLICWCDFWFIESEKLFLKRSYWIRVVGRCMVHPIVQSDILYDRYIYNIDHNVFNNSRWFEFLLVMWDVSKRLKVV